MKGLVFLEVNDGREQSSLCMHAPSKSHVRTYDGVAIYQPGRGLSADANLLKSRSWTFLSPDVWEINICWLSHVVYAAAAAKSLQSCPTLCDPIDSSPPGSPVPGILQARTLEWVAISSPMHESEKWKWSQKLSRVWLPRDPMDCSPLGSFVHGIFQTRVLEWGAIAFSDHLSYHIIYQG